MKTIVLIGAICVVILSFWLDVSQAQNTTNSSSSPTTSTGTAVPKKVTVSNLQYTAVRRIRVGTTTTSSTSTRSGRTKSKGKTNRNLRAKKNRAAKRTVASRSKNSRRVRR